MSPVAVLTPRVESEAIELGRTTFRKKVLPVGSLNYKGRQLNFTRPYLDGLASAFRDRAFDSVPLQLADADNRHTNDPERTRGDIVGLESSDEGLYATVSMTDKGAELVREHPDLGVSVRIVEDYARGDGKSWPAAMQHVLATWDPRVTGMGAWEPVSLSNDDGADQVIDLSGLVFDDPEPGSGQEGGPAVADAPETMTDAELGAQFRAFLATQQGGATGAPPATSEPDPEFTDEELDEFAELVWGPEGTPEHPEEQTVAASNVSSQALDLANSRIDDLARENIALAADRDRRNYEVEREQIARNCHVSPAMVDLARDLLEGSGSTVQLANGSTVDAGDVVRRLFTEFGKTIDLLDLSVELGNAHGAPESSVSDEDDAWVQAMKDRHFS